MSTTTPSASGTRLNSTGKQPSRPVDPVESLRRLIETREPTASEVGRGAGIAVTTLSSILNGESKPDLDHIGRLARYFKLRPAFFVD